MLATKTDESVWFDEARFGGWAWVERLEDIVGHVAIGAGKGRVRSNGNGERAQEIVEFRWGDESRGIGGPKAEMRR